MMLFKDTPAGLFPTAAGLSTPSTAGLLTGSLKPARLTNELTRVATLLQIPAITFSLLSPFANWLITSDSAKTVHVLEIVAGFSAFAANTST